MRRTAPWLIVAAAMLWATDAPFRKYLTGELPSGIIVLSEHILIGLFMLPVLLRHWSEFKSLRPKQWLAVLFIGFGGSALATVFFTQAFHHVSPSVAILLQKTQPFIAILLAWLLLRERLVKGFYLWAIVGIIGAYLISFPAVSPGELSVFSGGARGIVYALLAALLWGGSTVMGKYVLKTVSYPAMTAVRFLTALVFLFGLALWQRTLPAYGQFTLRDGLFVAIIALLAGLISLWMYYKGLKDTTASVSTIAELAFPFSAVLVNWIFLNDVLKPVQILGGLILLFAITRVAQRQNVKSADHFAEAGS